MWYIVLAVVLFAGFMAYQKGLFGKAIAKVKDVTNPAPSPVITPKPQPAPSPVTIPKPQPAPVESDILGEEYPSEEALKAFLVSNPGVGRVVLDDVRINEGFAPAAIFVTQPDGSVRR